MYTAYNGKTLVERQKLLVERQVINLLRNNAKPNKCKGIKIRSHISLSLLCRKGNFDDCCQLLCRAVSKDAVLAIPSPHPSYRWTSDIPHPMNRLGIPYLDQLGQGRNLDFGIDRALDDAPCHMTHQGIESWLRFYLLLLDWKRKRRTEEGKGWWMLPGVTPTFLRNNHLKWSPPRLPTHIYHKRAIPEPNFWRVIFKAAIDWHDYTDLCKFRGGNVCLLW